MSLSFLSQPTKTLQIIKQFFFWFCFGVIALGCAAFIWSGGQHGWVELPEPGESMRFYSNQTGDDLDRVLKRAIQQAHSKIYMEIFNLSEPSVIKLLNEKATEGVSIHIIVESKYYNKLKRQLNGVIQVSPGTTRGGLMHRKILVIDDQQSWLGSANFTWESLKSDSNLIAGACSQELAHLLVDPSSPSQGQVKIAGQAMEIWNIPEAVAPAEKLLEAIHRAKSHIHIAMFTWTRLDLAQAVVAARMRGVDVSVVMDRRAADGASEGVLGYLRENGIAVRIHSSRQTMHHKFLWVDDSRLFFGSVNWTEGGFRRNRDILVYIPVLTLNQEHFMQELWNSIWTHAKQP